MNDIYFNERKAHLPTLGNRFLSDEIAKAAKEAAMTNIQANPVEINKDQNWEDKKNSYNHPVPREGTQVRAIYDLIASRPGTSFATGEIEEKIGKQSHKWAGSLKTWAVRDDNPLRRVKRKRRVSYVYDLKGWQEKSNEQTRPAGELAKEAGERKRRKRQPEKVAPAGYLEKKREQERGEEIALISGLVNGDWAGTLLDGRHVVADGDGHLFAVTVERI